MNALKIDLLIAAAGKGTRSGLSYPKTLYKVMGQSILIRILNSTHKFINNTLVVASPTGAKLIQHELSKHYSGNFSVPIQKNPIGMGDAVLCGLQQLNASHLPTDVLLIWGDLPYVEEKTIEKLIQLHRCDHNDFSFITKMTDAPYTVVRRSNNGQVLSLHETKDNPNDKVTYGERDVGIFIFNPIIVQSQLENDLRRRDDRHEFGFLHIINSLVKEGYKVNGYPIATKHEDKSLNFISDIEIKEKKS